MRRGDVYVVEFEPVRGTEADKTRPAVLVSNDAANRSADLRGRGVVTVVPLTSNTGHVYPFQVLIRAGDAGLPVDSKAQAEQVRSVDYGRLREYVGTIPAPIMQNIDVALRTHLAL
jgi:mRNA interferase MazF